MKEKTRNKERLKLNNTIEIMQKNKTQKGITLVALVITIVILIILATVSINILLGEGGLINQAKLAGEQHKLAEYKEKFELARAKVAIDNLGDVPIDDYLEEIKNEGIATEDQIKDNGDGSYTVTPEPGIDIIVKPTEDGKDVIITYPDGIEGGDGGGSEVDPPVIEGIITIKPAVWQGDGTASVIINSDKPEYTIEYRVDKAEGNDVEWTEIQNGGTISNLKHGDVIFARLTDGNNYGDEASANILDGQAPTVSFSTSKTYNSITVTVNATDNESGLADNNIYTYSITGGSVEGESTVTKNENTHTFSGLTAETPYTVKVDVKDRANNTGSEQETVTTEAEPVKSEVGEAIDNETKYTETTPIKDDLENTVYIPGGFHLASDSATKVERGIVIEDDSGNQFVWIPTGEYKVTEEVDSDGTKDGKMTNALSRRTFSSSGETIVSGDSAIETGFYGEGDSRSIASGTIGTFLSSATTKGGFYIGRYEQGTGNVCKAGVDVYTNITRDTANSKAKAMYSGKTEIKATSELISSYAWDTALNFICQTNTEGYLLATTTERIYANIGTETKEKTGVYTADNYSNIHDIIGNCYEWTTEYYLNDIYTAVYRGSSYYDFGAIGSCKRKNEWTESPWEWIGFRLQLYVN